MRPLIPQFDAPVVRIPLPFEIFGSDVLPLHGFGLMVALGFIFGGKVAMDRAKRLGLDPDVINRLIGWLVVGTFVGGHVGYGLMYKPDEYFADPVKFLQVWQGLSSFGGFVVCVPLSVWFFMREKVPVWPYLDCLAHGMALGWALGRVGCFLAHDHPGSVTDFYLGVYGICREPGMEQFACHDMGLYESMFSMTMFVLFVTMDRWRAWTPGLFVILLGLVYGPVRFAMDFLRPEMDDPRYLMFTPGQYWAALLTVVCVVLLVRRMGSGDAAIGGPEPILAVEESESAA